MVLSGCHSFSDTCSETAALPPPAQASIGYLPPCLLQGSGSWTLFLWGSWLIADYKGLLSLEGARIQTHLLGTDFGT